MSTLEPPDCNDPDCVSCWLAREPTRETLRAADDEARRAAAAKRPSPATIKPSSSLRRWLHVCLTAVLSLYFMAVGSAILSQIESGVDLAIGLAAGVTGLLSCYLSLRCSQAVYPRPEWPWTAGYIDALVETNRLVLAGVGAIISAFGLIMLSISMVFSLERDGLVAVLWACLITLIGSQLILLHLPKRPTDG